MSIHTKESQINYRNPYTPMKVNLSMKNPSASQIGQVLESFGTIFKLIPPFNDHISESTSELLISLGKKLKETK